ncbi:MAG: DegT/DnrJ/EryC1/StrS family aminotransferase [Clostridia bacterium]|nr:DegT/DnrJ/EryC1/StrS family aminotransferase [Clostridia bacterium]
MEIFANRLDRAYRLHQSEYEEAALRVLRSGWYVLGNELKNFESEFASYLGGGECVGLASGLDALWITFRLLGIGAGDEVIVQGNTYIATVMGITINGATPVFAEPDAHYAMDASLLESLRTPRTKAVLVTHLYGMMTKMSPIVDFCRKHGLFLVEDCAQAHGCADEGKAAGTFGDVGCFSFYPTKNLGAFGDGGAVWTASKELADKFRVFRNYGSDKPFHNSVVGANSRLDELQAALLRVKLSHLDEMNEQKQRIAMRYLNEIQNPHVILPSVSPNTKNVWHQFVICCEQRDALATHLKQQGIGTGMHYPVPPHLSQAYQYLNTPKNTLPKTEHLANNVLSLPSYVGITEEEQSKVIEAVNNFQFRRTLNE